MPIKIIPVLFVFLLVWLVNLQSVNAQVIEDLYDAKISVADQSMQTQNSAFRSALAQVLIKVRGNKDLLANQKIRRALTKATQFVRSYSYDKQQSQLYLVINFDSQRIEDLIRNTGFPVWDKRRPQSLIWLAIKTTEQPERKLATPANSPDIYQQLNLQAKQRGISLLFPLWDLDDLQRLNVFDIWGAFSSQISIASERYAVPSILSARIYPAPSQLFDAAGNEAPENVQQQSKWLADWTMIEGGELISGQLQADDPIQIAEYLVDALADQLSMKYAIDLAQIDPANSKVQLVINNIDSLNYYTQALSALENMSVVNQATLIKQQGARATFELELLGDVEDLTNALSLDKKIKPVVDDFGQPILGLEFIWVK